MRATPLHPLCLVSQWRYSSFLRDSGSAAALSRRSESSTPLDQCARHHPLKPLAPARVGWVNPERYNDLVRVIEGQLEL